MAWRLALGERRHHPGTLVALINLSGMFFNPINEIARLLTDMQAGQAAGERVMELLSTEPKIKDTPPSSPASPPRGPRTPISHLRTPRPQQTDCPRKSKPSNFTMSPSVMKTAPTKSCSNSAATTTASTPASSAANAKKRCSLAKKPNRRLLLANASGHVSFALMRRFIAALLIAIAGCLLVACSPRETPVEEGIRTKTLLIGNSAEPGTLDPHLASILTDQIIINTLFEGLTVLDEETTQPLPAAAVSWETSDDGLKWTFHLRDGLKWSNGDPLVADDFIQAWRRALNPAFAADNAWYLFAIKNAEAYNAAKLTDSSVLGITAPDDRTIILTLEQPTPYLPALVSLPAWFPLNPRAMNKFGAMTQRGTPWTRAGNLVSNGAYQLTEWTPDARIVLSKNPHHRDAESAQLEHLVFRPIAKPDDEERNYRASQLHVTFNLPVTKLAPWRKRDAAQLRVDPLLQSNFIRFNITSAPFNDIRVRRAIALSIDRELLAETVLQGSRLAAHSITPPNIGGYHSTTSGAADFDQARLLLTDAGHAKGQGLPPIELMVRNDEIMPRLAEAIQAMWKTELGIAVTISQVEQKTWIQNQQNLDYDLCMSAWTADYPDPITFLEIFQGNSSYNWTGWNQPTYDALLARAAHITTREQRFAVLAEAETMLLNEAPVAPLFFGAQTYLIHPAVKGWAPSPLGFRRFQLVSLQP